MTSVDPHEIRILDAHHHFWDFDGPGYYPWLQGEYNDRFFLGDYTGMLHTFLPAQYRDATAGYRVVGTVHVEAERSREQEVDESRFLEGLHRTDPRFPAAAVAHASLARPDVGDVLAEHAEIGLVRGIRSKPVTSATAAEAASIDGAPGTMQDPVWLAGLAQLERHGFSWDLRVPYWHLEDAAAVVRDLPGIPVIINHCGLPLDRSEAGLDVWRRGLRALAALPNTTVKVSELGLPRNRWERASNERIVAETVEVFGVDRSMFASNLPVATLTAPSFGEVVDTVLGGLPGATGDELDQLFARTAARAYRVTLGD
jgi:predicted TIM-barrel fold metal-dependent hydrolase